MRSLWSDAEAAAYQGDLAQRVYTSRLLGRDPCLVLHGGGNTSVKLPVRDLFGDEHMVLYVKGSGWDLASIEPRGFSPCRLDHLLRLAQLEELSDAQMASELLRSLTDPSAPAPSVEAILHALLPHKFVDHTHADALLALTNTPGGERHVRAAYGDLVVVVPYVMPGFKLARACAELFPAQAHPGTIGMVLMHHGLFSFGATAREAYERMVLLVTLAEQYLEAHHAWRPSPRPPGAGQGEGMESPLPPAEGEAEGVPGQQSDRPAGSPPLQPSELAALRRDVSRVAGFPLLMSTHADPQALDFARRPDVARLSQQGPVTPDHVLRTRRVPLLGRDVEAYRAAYLEYFSAHAPAAGRPLSMLDPAPRVILDPELGLCALGRSAREAASVEEIYRHTIETILRAEALERYQALPPQAIFEVEYWDLEQAKLRRQGKPPPFAGEVALVTGAASGIGRACVDALLARGAAVVGLDIADSIVAMLPGPDFLGLRCDVADEAAVRQALAETARRYGGLDMLILNAGIFPASRRLHELALAEWQRTMRVNLDANLGLLREAHPLLKLAPRGGRVVVIGSKNVPAPGPGAAAYSVSKAALTQLARVAALEWGADRIRVNVLHPNMVFDTALWTEELLRQRAAQYGMSVEAYKTNNVLKVEVTSRDVAELAAELCGPLFARTTGAQIPVDGGNERVI